MVELNIAHLRLSSVRGTISAIVIVTFTMLILQPTALAVQAEYRRQQQQASLSRSDEEALSKVLQEVDERLQQFQDKLARKQDTRVEQDELKALRNRILELDHKVTRNFKSLERHIKDKDLPQIILQRHQEAIKTYRAELTTLLNNLNAINVTRDEKQRKQRLEEARRHLEEKKNRRTQQPFNPENLPYRSLKTKPSNKPKIRQEEFTNAGLYSNPYSKLAAVGPFRFDALSGANDPTYLVETIEVRLSEAVRAKAAELDHDPVKIYHWVRNHMEWLPTWGAMQDADLTLESHRGNAADIASLLIALLRASGIPSRYIHGTIDVPSSQFMNWAGGFERIEAAAEFVASGGVPVTTIVSGGKVTKVRLEHVWVEAAIDYHPSRGAVNLSADSWIELDPSYKQYAYQQGLDVAAIANLHSQTLGQALLTSGTVNESEDWIAGFDTAVIHNAQAQIRQALEDYIANNLSNPTVGEIIGGRRAIIQDHPMLPSALANSVVVRGVRYGDLPEALRNRIGFAFATDLFGELTGAKIFAWPQLNNQKVTLSFTPATPEDEQTLLSLLPEGEITDPSQLPTHIPAYLIRVIPELRINGKIVLHGSAIRLGEELPFAFSVTQLGHGTQVYKSPVVAGSYLSVAVVGGSVSPVRLTAIKQNLEATRATLESNDPTLLVTLTREDLLGDIFYAGTLGYFAQYLALGHVAALQQNAHFNLASSAGTYGYEPEVDYLFGFPRAIRSGGVAMDLDRVAVIASMSEGDNSKRVNFVMQLGTLSSALEHAVPEQMFVTPENPGEAVSAVKALTKAMTEGQRIYHITPANQVTTLPNIRQNRLTMQEIRQALAVGKEVITHTDPVSVPGWLGAGYIIFDPETGDGAYKIGGGKNGGFLETLQEYGFWYSLAAVALSTLLLIAGTPYVVLHVAVFIVTLAVATLVTMASHLSILENGCGAGLASLILALEFVAFTVALISGWGLFVGTILSLIYSSGIAAASNACRHLR